MQESSYDCLKQNLFERIAKPLFDIYISSMALLALSPLLTLVAIIIWMDSGLPIFYMGVRTGLNGRLFKMYKFRTMVQNAERLGGPSTGKNDPRVTRVGRFLRRHKLDELPQLLNVLRGEMSLVGPRPEVPEYTRLYKGDDELILRVRPGITDYASLRFINLAEVLGNNHVDKVYEDVVKPIKNRLRVRYVLEKTFWGDIRIILVTIVQLVRRESWNTYA